ncbi:hypothetical protein [Acetomicrobium sp.]|uniref:hypothetical protein n=1 Tax=Acetomicrobium sp. TaxID=1872099 RepID=UPI002FCB6742
MKEPMPNAKKTSTQMHYHRAEHWIVVKDTAKVTIEDKTAHAGGKESAPSFP